MIWRLTYCNKKGVEARVDIIKGNRTPVEVVQGSGNPFTLSYKLDKNDKSGHIMTSSADVEIFETDTFNIDDLKTSNETELKVEYFEDNVLTWSGFVLPDFFSREIGYPNIVRMTASDRLTALKGVTLSDLPSRISLRDLIELSLAQTGLSLGLVSQIQISQGSTNILDSEILSQRLTDTKGRSVNCYDILMSIMVGTNSTIRQSAGQWQIYNKLEHELRTPTIFFDKVEKGAIRTIQPVASSVGVYNEFGGNRLHPNNYDFSLGLANWTSKNGFEAYTDNRVVSYFLGGTPIYQPDVTTKDYLVNLNNWITNETNLDTAPFLESNNIPISSTQDNTVEVEVDISAVMAEKLSSYTVISFLRYAIIATNGVDTYALTTNGIFEAYDPEKIEEHSIVLRGGQQEPLLLVSPAYANSSKRKGVLEVNNVNDFHVNIRIYGSSFEQYVNLEFVSVRFGNKTETPKGNLYKTTQGSNFTKIHDIETVIFGDYIRKGLNGYFYDYPIDDTSILYLPNGEISSPTWETIFDTTERPLLHHISRQKSRLFSVAHDILKANINVDSFDPLAVFQDCKGGKYVVVSASFDFLRSEVDVELEQIAYDNTILKRDYIYSYFGEGEDTIKSIGGIASGGGGTGGGGGMTSEQLEMLTNLADWWKLDEENDAIYSEKSVYSLKGVSALGLGSEGGGGGGGVDMLNAWANYTTAKADYYVPASLLVPFRNDTLSRLASLEAGGGGGGSSVQMEDYSATFISLTVDGLQRYLARSNHNHNIFALEGINPSIGFTEGYVLTWNATTFKLELRAPTGGNGGVSDSVDWVNITNKPSTFAPSSHNHDTLYKPIRYAPTWGEVTGKPTTFAPSAHAHTIANVTGLQSALDLKAPLASPTFTGNVTAPTFVGALSGNASSATNCSRSILAGDGLTGGGVLNANRTITLGTPSTLTNATTNGVTGTSHTHAITTTTVGAANTIVATDASGGVRGNIIRIGGNWTLELSGTELWFKYGGVVKQRMFQDGSFVATGGVAAFSQGVEADTLDLLRLKLNQGGGDSKYLSSTATQIYFDIGGATPLSMTKTEVRRGNTDNNVNLGTSAYPWANIYGVNLIASTHVSTPKITLGNGWTIEQTSASLTIRRNGEIKGTFNA